MSGININEQLFLLLARLLLDRFEKKTIMNEGGDTHGAASLSELQKKKKFWEETRQLDHKY